MAAGSFQRCTDTSASEVLPEAEIHRPGDDGVDDEDQHDETGAEGGQRHRIIGGTCCGSRRLSQATPPKASRNAATLYTPVSAEYQNANAVSSAAPTANGTGFHRSSRTAYQPRRNAAKQKMPSAVRPSHDVQKTPSSRSSRNRFHAGCSGSSNRSAK